MSSFPLELEPLRITMAAALSSSAHAPPTSMGAGELPDLSSSSPPNETLRRLRAGRLVCVRGTLEIGTGSEEGAVLVLVRGMRFFGLIIISSSQLSLLTGSLP